MPTNPSQPPTPQLNPDPITGEPGSHPVGTGVGATAGGAMGAALGAIGGPIGVALGVVIGAVVGGLAGKGVAEVMDPTVEDAYWRKHHHAQTYAKPGSTYEDFAPAYRTGYGGYRLGKTFDEREADLRMEYEGGPQKAEAEAAIDAPRTESIFPAKQRKSLPWDDAREAARAAYERVSQAERNKAERMYDY